MIPKESAEIHLRLSPDLKASLMSHARKAGVRVAEVVRFSVRRSLTMDAMDLQKRIDRGD